MLRILVGLLILATVLVVVGSGHYYIARRLVLDPAMPDPFATLVLAGIAAGFASLIATPIAERLLPRRLASALVWPATLWMGFAWIQLVILGAFDLGAAILGASVEAWAPTAGTLAVATYAAAALAATWAIYNGRRSPALVEVDVQIERWPAELDGFSIAQISDVHIGHTLGRDFAAHLVERCNALDADVVAVTGDLVDGAVHHLRDQVEPFAGMRAREGVFFVTGNHDHYSGARAWVDVIRDELGWRPLRNTRVEIKRGPAVFDLAGVDDHRGDVRRGGGRSDLDAALAGRDPERPVVLLAHSPETFPEAIRAGVDLQLSGHTHAGQIWPFRYLVRLSTRFVSGLYRRGRSQVYVSQGTGYWGPPMRLGTRAEITLLRVRAAGSASV